MQNIIYKRGVKTSGRIVIDQKGIPPFFCWADRWALKIQSGIELGLGLSTISVKFSKALFLFLIMTFRFLWEPSRSFISLALNGCRKSFLLLEVLSLLSNPLPHYYQTWQMSLGAYWSRLCTWGLSSVSVRFSGRKHLETERDSIAS